MAVTVSTDADFKTHLANNERVVVKFFAGWCGTCRLFAPKYKRMSDEEGFDGIAFLDVDAEKNPEARKMAGVSNLPFFATFKNGELVKADFTSKEDTVRGMIEEIKA